MVTDTEYILNKYNNTKDNKNYKGFYQLVVKRIIDIIVSIIGLPIVVLILIPLSILIKFEDGGPVFYSSKRIGIGFSEFGMLKLRTMKVDARDIRNKDGSTFNSEDDDRVTKIGRVLRETSLDEIPQLFNVLIGQMSLIGPRAGDVESRDTYEKDEKDKTLVRPGISGLTQAYYRNSMGVRDKRLLDAWYAHNVSFVLDIKIVLKTVKSVLKRENIYTNH